MSDYFGHLPTSNSRTSDLDTQVPPIGASGGRWLRRRFAGGVVALTTVAGETFRAATLTACVPVSIDPPQFLVSIELDSQMDGWLLQSGVFALNVLSWRQQFFADQFAGYAPLASRSFRDIRHVVGVTGCPILTECLAWAECQVMTTLVTGDHRCFIAEAISLGSGEGDATKPLLYFHNRYATLP